MKPLVSGMALVGILADALRAQAQASPPSTNPPSINLPAPWQPQASSKRATGTLAPAATETREFKVPRRAG
jgi:hypothetical protein